MGNIKPFERQALTRFAIETMSCISRELPRTYFLSSSDRKGYTIETSLSWRDKNMTFHTLIDPWVEDKESLVKRIEEDAKHQFADSLYDDGSLNV